MTSTASDLFLIVVYCGGGGGVHFCKLSVISKKASQNFEMYIITKFIIIFQLIYIWKYLHFYVIVKMFKKYKFL